MANQTAKLLNLRVTFALDEVTIYDEYIGKGYGIITEGCLQAIKLVAHTEGIFFDPIYTGKAMAGLFAYDRGIIR